MVDVYEQKVPWGFQANKPGYKQAAILRIDESFTGMLNELVEDWAKRCKDYAADGWVGLEVVNDGWDYWLIGYRPLTDKEKASAKRRSQKAKEAAAKRKAKKEAEEREVLAKLKEKYEV
jgi:hypothetical protein